MVVINSVYSSSVVAPSRSSTSVVTSDLTIRAIAPGGFDYASRFTCRSDLDDETQTYRDFVNRAKLINKMSGGIRTFSTCGAVAEFMAHVRHGKMQKIMDILSSADRSSERWVDEYGNTPLIVACQNNRIQIAEYLISHGRANVDGRNFSGNTGLHYAFKYRYSELVSLLINKYGADTSVRNSCGVRCFDMTR